MRESGGLCPSPFFPVTALTGRRENAGGWHRLWTLGLGLSLPPAPPALRLCIPVCLCAVVSLVCGLLCDYLNDSIHCLCHVRLCKCNYVCIRAASIQPLNVEGFGGNKTYLNWKEEVSPRLRPVSESQPLHQMGKLACAWYQEETRWRVSEHPARGLMETFPAAAAPVSALH